MDTLTYPLSTSAVVVNTTYKYLTVTPDFFPSFLEFLASNPLKIRYLIIHIMQCLNMTVHACTFTKLRYPLESELTLPDQEWKLSF